MLTGMWYVKNLVMAKVNRFLRDEKGEVNIVATVVLIGIAVVLAVVFRKAIGGLINSLLNTINKTANNAIDPN